MGNSIRFSRAFGDNMVVQRDADLKIWGYASPECEGDSVRVTFKGQTACGRIVKCRWSVIFEDSFPASAELGHDIVVCNDNSKEEARIKDVLVGDVWFVGGQSNAEMSFYGTSAPLLDYYAEYLNAAPDLTACRLFKQASNDVLPIPEDERQTRHEEPLEKYSWQLSTPESAAAFSMMGYFFAYFLSRKHPDIPLGLIAHACGCASLAVLASKEITSKYPEEICIDGGPFTQHCIYNLFYAPFEGMSARGMIFYQGEAHIGCPKEFETAMEIFVGDLHAKYGDDFLFLNVQLPTYGIDEWLGVENLRYVQAKQFIKHTIPNYYVTATYDVGWRRGDPDGAHPNYKLEIGQRLADIADAVVYGGMSERDAYPPYPQAFHVDNDGTLSVEFNGDGGGLQAKGGGELIGFEVLKGGEWQQVKARIHNGIFVAVGNTENVEGVRYAAARQMHDIPIPNLVSGRGVPALAFQFGIDEL